MAQVGEEDKGQHSGANPFIQLIEDADGLDKVERLQEHQNEEIYEKAVGLLETYFDLEEEENLVPPGEPQGIYSFGQGGPAVPPQGGFNFGT